MTVVQFDPQEVTKAAISLTLFSTRLVAITSNFPRYSWISAQFCSWSLVYNLYWHLLTHLRSLSPWSVLHFFQANPFTIGSKCLCLDDLYTSSHLSLCYIPLLIENLLGSGPSNDLLVVTLWTYEHPRTTATFSAQFSLPTVERHRKHFLFLVWDNYLTSWSDDSSNWTISATESSCLEVLGFHCSLASVCIP